MTQPTSDAQPIRLRLFASRSPGGKAHVAISRPAPGQHAHALCGYAALWSAYLPFRGDRTNVEKLLAKEGVCARCLRSVDKMVPDSGACPWCSGTGTVDTFGLSASSCTSCDGTGRR